MVEWEEVDGWIEGYGNDVIDKTEEDTMKIYGKEAIEHYVNARELAVATDFPSHVQMKTGGRDFAFLTPDEVDDLVHQLSDWLLTRQIGEEK